MRVFLAAIAFYLYYKWEPRRALNFAFWVTGGWGQCAGGYGAALAKRDQARKLASDWGAPGW